MESEKDSSRFLQAGATRSFYIQAANESTVLAFQRLIELLRYSSPIVCESPSLARGIIPGALIVVTGEGKPASGSEKDLSFLDERSALRITSSDVDSGKEIPVGLNETGFMVPDTRC